MQWIAVVLAHDFLEGALSKHERERQPEIVNRASELLSALTEGKWSLFSQIADGLSISLEDSRGIRCSEERRSAGLTDQTTLAISVAMAEYWNERFESLPLILDDVWGSLDRRHLISAAELLAEKAERMQVVCLTCRQEVAALLLEAAKRRSPAPQHVLYEFSDAKPDRTEHTEHAAIKRATAWKHP
jgi:uncharacterized protein YhaN